MATPKFQSAENEPKDPVDIPSSLAQYIRIKLTVSFVNNVCKISTYLQRYIVRKTDNYDDVHLQFIFTSYDNILFFWRREHVRG